MTKAANPEHRDRIAPSGTTVSQRVESRYAGAHQRRAINRREFVRRKRQCLRGRNHILGVPAVERNTGGKQRHRAREEFATPAMVAIAAVPAMPTNPDALAILPWLHVPAHADTESRARVLPLPTNRYEKRRTLRL